MSDRRGARNTFIKPCGNPDCKRFVEVKGYRFCASCGHRRLKEMRAAGALEPEPNMRAGKDLQYRRMRKHMPLMDSEGVNEDSIRHLEEDR